VVSEIKRLKIKITNISNGNVKFKIEYHCDALLRSITVLIMLYCTEK